MLTGFALPKAAGAVATVSEATAAVNAAAVEKAVEEEVARARRGLP